MKGSEQMCWHCRCLEHLRSHRPLQTELMGQENLCRCCKDGVWRVQVSEWRVGCYVLSERWLFMWDLWSEGWTDSGSMKHLLKKPKPTKRSNCFPASASHFSIPIQWPLPALFPLKTLEFRVKADDITIVTHDTRNIISILFWSRAPNWAVQPNNSAQRNTFKVYGSYKCGKSTINYTYFNF